MCQAPMVYAIRTAQPSDRMVEVVLQYRELLIDESDGIDEKEGNLGRFASVSSGQLLVDRIPQKQDGDESLSSASVKDSNGVLLLGSLE